jgi:hypothetical protein
MEVIKPFAFFEYENLQSLIKPALANQKLAEVGYGLRISLVPEFNRLTEELFRAWVSKQSEAVGVVENGKIVVGIPAENLLKEGVKPGIVFQFTQSFGDHIGVPDGAMLEGDIRSSQELICRQLKVGQIV